MQWGVNGMHACDTGTVITREKRVIQYAGSSV